MENIQKLLGELASKFHERSTKQPSAPDPPSSPQIRNPTPVDGKTMSKAEGKTILDLPKPINTKQEFQTSTSMSILATRPTRNRRPVRYQLSPYDKVSRGAKAKFKAGPFYVNNPLSLDQLMLIQYAFDRDGNGSEIIMSTHDQFISRHNFMSLLPNTALNGDIITMIAYHLTLRERAKRENEPINWYLPTVYAQSALTVGADVDGFAQAASVGKPFMPDF